MRFFEFAWRLGEPHVVSSPDVIYEFLGVVVALGFASARAGYSQSQLSSVWNLKLWKSGKELVTV
jgi:hypothetical protein